MQVIRALMENLDDQDTLRALLKVKVATMLQSNFRRKVAYRKIFKPKDDAKKKQKEARE